MATKLTVLTVPSQLRYDHGEMLPGGAQFFRFDTLEELKTYWAHGRVAMRYACVGTGFMSPARFLDSHDWIFSPSKEALVAAVVRWDELSTRHHLQRRRARRRDLRMALGNWSAEDEAAYVANSRLRGRGLGRHGLWRLDNLPCGLTHFDWFSEHAKFPDDPELPREHVKAVLLRTTLMIGKTTST
jgi:hypothetical protein